MTRTALFIRKWKATATNPDFLWPEDVTNKHRQSRIAWVAANPKTEGKRPWRRFNCYKTGMTGQEYIDAVIKRKVGNEAEAVADLAWDNNHFYIRWEASARTLTTIVPLPKERPKPPANPVAKEIADHFFAEVKRMASTAMQTVAYANGQSVIVTVKIKDTDFKNQQEMELEIAAILERDGYCCALTGYNFRRASKNPHLRPSLDRKNSAFGYIRENLQVVTRAANFYKSASDEVDWDLKAKAMRQMALAMQQRKDGEGPNKG